jgi:putative spermidine/putrescine transport system permease protein
MPSFLIVFFITAYVLVNTFIESLGLIPELFLHEITFKHYMKLMGDKIFMEGFLFSLIIALISSTISISAGTYLSYVLSQSKKGVTAFMYRYPIILSYIAAAVLVYNTYSSRGLIYHIFLFFGLETGSLDIIYNSKGIGVILLNAFKGIPFVAFSLYPIFIKADSEYRETAKNLGCTDTMYVYKVLLPLCRHSILTSFLIIFNYNLFSYEGYYFLGPSKPVSIGVLAYSTYINPDLSMRASSMAVNFVMMAVSIVLCVIFYKSLKQVKKGTSL